METSLPILSSALVLGFAGSVHCLAMCGGIAGALDQAATDRRPFASFTRMLFYSLGRLASYASAGALAGLFGSVFAGAANALPLVRFAIGIVIVAIGFQIATAGRAFAPLERAGLAVWRLAAPLARRIGRPERAWQFVALGLVWGWLPCGLVYSGLLIAAASGRAATGALAMAAFGLGTLPAVWAATGLGAAIARLGGGAAVRRSAGVVLVGFGLWSIVGTWAFHALHAGHDPSAHGHAPFATSPEAAPQTGHAHHAQAAASSADRSSVHVH